MELTVRIHSDEETYWADVPELPGCFASGDSLDELFESLQEGIALYLADDGASGVRIERRTIRPPLAPAPDPS
jgi:predicted RNase H-like HicB family nuclease